MADQAHIRNFSIIAHIDHGKSTLADRILELTHTVDRARDARAGARLDGPRARARDHDQGAGGARLLHGARRRDLPAAPDRHARPRRLHLRGRRARWRRARARCWSSTPRRASRRRRSPTPTSRSTPGLELIPCLNKIDLPGAEPERVAGEVAELIGEPRRVDPADQRQDRRGRRRGARGADRSACRRRRATRTRPPRALIFDSEFDQYRGVIAYIRVVDGVFRKGEAIRAMATGTEADIDDIGFFTPADDADRPARARARSAT